MEQEQWPTIVALAVCLGATTAAAVAASIWWRTQRKRTGKGIRRRLAVTPGIRVVKIQDTPTESNGSSGWGGLIGMGALSGKGEATRWEQSKNKGDLGYYFAHHTSHKELAPDEYQMNSPKLLSKGGDAPAAATNGSKSAESLSPSLVGTQRRRAQQITSYSWEDYGEEVRLTFRQSGWEWGKVEATEIGVEWGPRRLRMSIDSREYGLHTIDLQTLSGEVGDVRVLKMKSRLVVTLVKGGRGSYSKKTPWEKLQSPPEKRSKDD